MGEVSTVTTNPMEDFQNKLKEKVRADIAALLPDDAIASLVQKAIEEEFFKKAQKNIGSSYSPQWVDMPSVFVQEVVKAADPIMKKEIAKAVEDQRPLIEAGIKAYLADNNLTLIIAAAIGQAMQNNIFNVAQEILSNTRRSY